MGIVLAIEHVGSTSIPRMSAKPIIDIDIVIRKKDFNQVKSILEQNGYSHEGDLGIKGREAFKLMNSDYLKDKPEHHLYICDINSLELMRHIAFRNYLRNNEKDARRYEKLKLELARKFHDNRELYQEGKSWIIEELLTKIFP
jgi:GrpB-like predicted nucleotidyltransferase (UPF0157 family)